MLQAFDENIWVAIAFVAFIALVWKRAGAALTGLLDRKSEEIAATLKEARDLRDEAETELKIYRRKAREAEAEARRITDAAEKSAEAIRQQAVITAENAIKRRQEQAESKIKALEDEVTAELRARAAELGGAAAAEIIRDGLDKKSAEAIVKKDIADLRKTG